MAEKRLIDANELLKDARRCRAILASLADIVDIEILVADAPTVDAVEVVHGRWMEFNTMMTCSVCDKNWYYNDNNCDEFNYCPNCGAKMDGDDDDK